MLVYYIVKPQYTCRSINKKHVCNVPTLIKPHAFNPKKPKCAVEKVIYLKAIMPSHGCGIIATTFNRLYIDTGESVSKTFVYEKLKANKYQLATARRDIKNKPPYFIPINRTYGIDLTTANLSAKQQIILGIVDHGSRLNLKLQHL